MAQTTDPTPKTAAKATMSHAIPFAKNHLGVGAVVAAVIALVNSKLAVVAPPWLLWAVVGLLVVGWIVHTIATDHVLIKGAMISAANESVGHGITSWLGDLAEHLPGIIALFRALEAAKRGPAGASAQPGSDPTPPAQG